MARKKDVCRLCGDFTEMDYEHIPPKKAFNEIHRKFPTIEYWLMGRKTRKFRREGIGEHSLCPRCNSTTGGWYAPALINWARQGKVYIEKIEHGVPLYLLFKIQPLNVLKQILVMMIAMSSIDTKRYHDDLRYALLDRQSQAIPPKYRVFVYFNLEGGNPRFESGYVVAKKDGREFGVSYIDAEVALPPFGYHITSSLRDRKTIGESQGLCEITDFSHYRYNQIRQVFLKMPALETHEPFPLDYRSKSEVDDHYRRMGL
ncbi:MAG: hypothetical protein JXA10_11510 [Anaerolineae bacterium]|nr:hypothetical protein [Anaerolineae bacterium]